MNQENANIETCCAKISDQISHLGSIIEEKPDSPFSNIKNCTMSGTFGMEVPELLRAINANLSRLGDLINDDEDDGWRSNWRSKILAVLIGLHVKKIENCAGIIDAGCQYEVDVKARSNWVMDVQRLVRKVDQIVDIILGPTTNMRPGGTLRSIKVPEELTGLHLLINTINDEPFPFLYNLAQKDKGNRPKFEPGRAALCLNIYVDKIFLSIHYAYDFLNSTSNKSKDEELRCDIEASKKILEIFWDTLYARYSFNNNAFPALSAERVEYNFDNDTLKHMQGCIKNTLAIAAWFDEVLRLLID